MALQNQMETLSKASLIKQHKSSYQQEQYGTVHDSVPLWGDKEGEKWNMFLSIQNCFESCR